tara:strand:+ start:1035 stop:1217 length:183 start_codon:yes stop_codon:yes gene_type:complete
MKLIFISVSDMCTMLAIKKTKAFELLRLELVVSIRIGGRRYILFDSVTAYADKILEEGKS